MKLVLILSGLPALIVGGALWRGWVLTKLWLWFIVPTFSAVELTLPAATGIALIASYLTSHDKASNKDKVHGASTFAESLFFELAYPAIVLLIGWIVSFFMQF